MYVTVVFRVSFSSVIISAVSLTGSCLGVIVGFPAVGYLMDGYSPMSFAYAMVASSILEFILLIIMHILSIVCVPKTKEKGYGELEMKAIPLER